eukprot:1018904-Rhodomonas_salina.1
MQRDHQRKMGAHGRPAATASAGAGFGLGGSGALEAAAAVSAREKTSRAERQVAAHTSPARLQGHFSAPSCTPRLPARLTSSRQPASRLCRNDCQQLQRNRMGSSSREEWEARGREAEENKGRARRGGSKLTGRSQLVFSQHLPLRMTPRSPRTPDSCTKGVSVIGPSCGYVEVQMNELTSSDGFTLAASSSSFFFRASSSSLCFWNLPSARLSGNTFRLPGLK